MEKIDIASKAFDQILSEIKDYQNTIFSEEDTRVKIIDRIFIEVLNYPFKDFTTEDRAGSGFLDYRFNVNGLARLIVEAKRDGVKFNIDDQYGGRAFVLSGPVFRDKIIQDGLEQAIYYAAHKSVELACLTNGHTWIIFRANRIGDGKDVLDGKGIVFSSLDSVRKNFKLFYELLSPDSIIDLNFRAIFQEVEGGQIRKKDFSMTLVNEDTLKLMPGGAHSHDFDRVMTSFFSKLNGDSDPDFIIDCFVETKESLVADQELYKISEELISKIKTLETSEATALQEVIERVKTTSRHEFVLLVGGKGAGKSTFIERFFKKVLSPALRNETILIRVNLGEAEGNVGTIIDWLNYTLLEEAEKVLFKGRPTFKEIQGIFFYEYDRLRKGPWKPLYDKNKDQFKINFGKHIEERRESRPGEYIKRLIGDITRSRKKVPVLVFDNADHFGIEFQEKVFQYARAIYEKEICLVLIPITDKTSWQLSKQGAIQSFENETLFLPTPSPKKIIEKRIEYLEKKLKEDTVETKKYLLGKGIKLELKNVQKFVKFLQLLFLKDPIVAKWIGSLANYDIRRCLELTRDIISSPHIPLEDLFVSYYKDNDEPLPIKLYKIKNAIIKRNYTTYPVGQHKFVQNLYYLCDNINTTPLLSLRILQMLIDRRNDDRTEENYVFIDHILDYFSGMGIEHTDTMKHLDSMLKKGLIYSYDPTITNVSDSKKVEITSSGLQHHYWSSSDNDYLHIMVPVTQITDDVTYLFIEENFWDWSKRNEILIEFIYQLQEEDKIYCHVPKHEAYKSQLFIGEKFEQRRKQLALTVTQ